MAIASRASSGMRAGRPTYVVKMPAMRLQNRCGAVSARWRCSP
jgi:hypothetical protein